MSSANLHESLGKGNDKKQKKAFRSYQNRQVEVVCNRIIFTAGQSDSKSALIRKRDLFSSRFLLYAGEGTGVPAPVETIVAGDRFVGDALFFNIGKKVRAGCGSLGRACPIILAAGEFLFSSLIRKPHGLHLLKGACREISATGISRHRSW